MTEEAAWRAVHRRTRDRVGDPVARWLCEEAGATDDLVGSATPRMLDRLDAMVERHLAGEPLAYVLGHWSFRHLDLAVDRRVLIPRPETEVVAGVAIELARAMPRPLTIADLGTGSGAIGLALADELPLEGITVWLTDVSADAIDVARANLAGLGRRGRNVRIAAGSWFDALPRGTTLDLAVANPPYIAAGSPDVEAAVREWEPPGALFAGPAGLDAIGTIAAAAPRWTRAGGWLVLEIGADQAAAVAALLPAADYDAVEIRPDLAGRDRVAIARVR
jgi:release factor glutamine methyltransferase